MAMVTKEMKKLFEGRYPRYTTFGLYPIFYMSDDGRVWCPDCASQEDAEPEITQYDVNYEDEDLYCEGCGKRIESAYGDEVEKK